MDATLSLTDRSSSRAARTIESGGLRSTSSASRTSSRTGILLMPRNHWRPRPSHTREPRAARNLNVLTRWYLRPTKVLTRHTLAHLLLDYQSQSAGYTGRTGLTYWHESYYRPSARPLARVALVY